MRSLASVVGGRSRPTTSIRDRSVLAVLMWLLLVGHLVWAMVGGGRISLRVDGVLGGLTQWMPAVCMWAAFARTGERRPEQAAAVGVTAFAAGVR